MICIKILSLLRYNDWLFCDIFIHLYVMFYYSEQIIVGFMV